MPVLTICCKASSHILQSQRGGLCKRWRLWFTLVVKPPFMTPEATKSTGKVEGIPNLRLSFDADRVGVVASALCAIHCAITPIVIILLPAFGRIWAHPISHWAMAGFVVPIAAVMMSRGYMKHHKRWVIVAGFLGIVLVLAGAAAPSLEQLVAPPATPGTADSCCPSVGLTSSGGWGLQFPLSSILTTLGGVFLIATHVGNLCHCSACRKS